VSFTLPGTGKLTVDQVNKFYQTQQGVHGSLANQNTPEAKAFMKRLSGFQAVKDKAIGGARYDTLTDVEADRVRTAAAAGRSLPDCGVPARAGRSRAGRLR